MLEILYFAIVTNDESMVIAILKVLPKEILFFDKAHGDYLVSLLKHYNCKRAFDFLKSRASNEVKASTEIKIEDDVLPKTVIKDTFDKTWDDICSLSRQKVSFEEFKQQFTAYDSLLTIATNYPVIHCMRAASVAFLLQDYAVATRHFEEGITHLRKNTSKKFTPDTLVDETLTELTFRLFAALSVKPSEQYMHLFKNNLYRIRLAFCIGQDAFLFPLTATLNYQTVKAVNASLTEFIHFKRQLPITELAYRDSSDFKIAVKVHTFVIRRFYEWLVSLEKQNSLTISYNSQAELDNLISKMKFPRLEFIHEFYGMKKSLLDIFKQCYRLQEIEDEWPYKNDFDTAVAIEKCTQTRFDKLTFAQVIQYVGVEEPTQPIEEKSPKKKKRKPAKKEEKPPVPPTTPPKPDKSLDGYAELPTYYPDVMKFTLPGSLKLRTKIPCLFFACPDTKSGLKEQEKLAKSEVEELVVTNPPTSHFIIRQIRQNNSSGLFSALLYVDFVDSANKDNFFAIHPEYYLEAVYLASEYKTYSKAMILAFNDAKTHIANTLYQVPDHVLRAQFDTFVSHFGMLEAGKIFIRYGVFRFLVSRGIFPIQQPDVLAEKDIATSHFRS